MHIKFLSQLLAVEQSISAETHKRITELYHLLAKTTLFNGYVRTYQKINEEDAGIPDEEHLIQYEVNKVINDMITTMISRIDTVATRDNTNSSAKADLILPNGTVESVPVTHLLWLEKEIAHVIDFIANLPVLNAGAKWIKDADLGIYRSKETKTQRTKKVPKSVVLYPATDKHPAQVEKYHEDVVIGYYNLTDFSATISSVDKQALLVKAREVLQCVKIAREQANCAHVVSMNIGEMIMNYIFK